MIKIINGVIVIWCNPSYNKPLIKEIIVNKKTTTYTVILYKTALFVK